MTTRKRKSSRLRKKSRKVKRDKKLAGLRDKAIDYVVEQDIDFQSLSKRFGIKKPQQLRDQVMWQGIREIRRKMARNEDDHFDIEVQDQIFDIAQAEENQK